VAKEAFPALDGATTLFELFQRSVGKYPNNECLGRRETVNGQPGPYTYLTYKQTDEQVTAIASALVNKAGVKPHSRVGVFSANCPEWMIAMQACNRQTAYCVPLYDSLGENAIEYIIHHAEVTVAFTSAEKFPQLLKAIPMVKDRLQTVVYWGIPPEQTIADTKAAGLQVFSYDEFLALGKQHPAEPMPPKPEDLCTIMYTSGTTGDPKGVLLTHSALCYTIAGLDAFLDQVGEKLHEEDVMLSYLPLAHIFDRTAEEQMLYLGAKIGYWRGDIKGLIDDIGELKPTLFIGVPRVFDRIYTGVLAKMEEAGGLKKFLFNWGYKRKTAFLAQGRRHNEATPLFDKVVFSKVKARLGGRVRLIVTGGAPLAKHTEEFLKVTMCAPVVQGYGLTETCAASCIAVPDTWEMSGTVGPPLPCTEMRLEAVPEMNYLPTDNPPRGEICFRGPTVFSGYYKQEDKTVEVLDKDGWFHTGDIGELTAAGAVRIFDRKKNIFKLAQGEYIAVEKVEAVYKKNPLVEQIWVYGNSFESTLVAVVVPIEDRLRAGGKEQSSGSFAELCKSDAARTYVLQSLNETAKEGSLKGFEQIKSVYLDPNQFSVENEMMTPTFKLKRPQLQKYYQAQVDAMYKSINQK
jgi:long-chain acyl-CoA synthetase